MALCILYEKYDYKTIYTLLYSIIRSFLTSFIPIIYFDKLNIISLSIFFLTFGFAIELLLSSYFHLLIAVSINSLNMNFRLCQKDHWWKLLILLKQQFLLLKVFLDQSHFLNYQMIFFFIEKALVRILQIFLDN